MTLGPSTLINNCYQQISNNSLRKVINWLEIGINRVIDIEPVKNVLEIESVEICQRGGIVALSFSESFVNREQTFVPECPGLAEI